MTWIKTIPQTEAGENLKRAVQNMRGAYPPEYATEVEKLKQVAPRAMGGSISDSHSLLPDTLFHAFMTFGTLMSPELPLSRAQHEMIATTVSVLNECFY